ncbi:MAG: hypothetical protein PWQ49_1277 [Methanohalophilus sp.]|nr:hypothetical protein [Methanohalophilus sp.]
MVEGMNGLLGYSQFCNANKLVPVSSILNWILSYLKGFMKIYMSNCAS